MTSSVRFLRRAVVAGVSVVALCAVTTAPAGAATDAEEWGNTFCSETVGWLQGALDGANALQVRAVDPTLTPADGKALVVEFLETGVRSTKSYGKAVKAAGAPDIDNGVKIQAAILAGIAGSGAKLSTLEKAAEKLPTKPPAAFQKGATRIGNQLKRFSDPFARGMAKAGVLDEGGQLGGVLESLPACAPLTNGAL